MLKQIRAHSFLPPSGLKAIHFYEIGVFLLLAFVTWGARFSSSKQFGLYYEDWGRIPLAMAWRWSDWLEYLVHIPGWMIKFNYEGRPLHPASIHTFAFLGQQLGGLPATYWLGYGIAALNTYLYYLLLKRISGIRSFALFGALTFALFPAHTSQALLTITLGILPALTLLLVAFHLYLDGRKGSVLASYGVILLSVFCYEKFLLPFCVAPLLKKQWSQGSWREWGRHSGLVVAILGLVAIGRKIAGEGRVSRLEVSSFFKPLLSLGVGPVVAMNTFLERPVQVLTSIRIEWWIPLGLFFLAMAYAIYRSLSFNCKTEFDQVLPEWSDNTFAKPETAAITTGRFSLKPPHWSRLAIAGLLMLILAYPLNFLDSPHITEGRTSFVHVAAVVGASLLWACGCSFIFSLSVFADRKVWITGLASAYFTLLMAFGFIVQQDYVIAAQYQRAFWTQVVKLCPDMTAGTVILVEPDVFKAADQIRPIQPLSGGHFPRILGYLYQFPAAWTQGVGWEFERGKFKRSLQPKIYELRQDWRKSILSKDNTMSFDLSRKVINQKQFAGLKVRSSDVILIGSKQGKLFREPGPLILKEQAFPLKQNDSNLELPPFSKGVLHDDFIELK